MDFKVKFFDYPLQFKCDEKKYLEIMRDTLGRGAYVLCKDLEAFENNLARFCGTKHAIGVGNCTDALLLSLIAAGVGRGDEVVCVSHTFVATIEVIHFLGAKPVFVDIREDHNMDVRLVEKTITKKTKVIIPVHLNGRICTDMDKLVALAKKKKIFIVEDAAQSLGARFKGKNAGSFGLAGCFSFYPAKLLGAFGDAGAVVTDDDEVAYKIRNLRNHGRDKTLDIEMWGLNCRMDNLQAAILNYKLTRVPAWIKRRREIAYLYDQELKKVSALSLPPRVEDKNIHFDVFQNYELEAERRDELVVFLRQKGIQTILPWGGKAVHQFKDLKVKTLPLPKTDAMFKKVLMIPLYPELEDEHVLFVAKKIKKFYTRQQKDINRWA